MNLRLGALLRPKYTLLQNYIHTIETITVGIKNVERRLSYGIKGNYSRGIEHKHEKMSFGRQRGHSNKNEEIYQKE
jgi:hypothetical protein